MRARCAFACGLLCALFARSAEAEDSKRSCIAAFEDGQRFQLKGDLELAAARFDYCQSDRCPTGMHHECEQFLGKLQASMPAVVFSVNLAPEVLTPNVWVSIDDSQAQTYSGEALHVNPGTHQFTFGCDGCRPVSRRIQFSDPSLKRKTVELNAANAEPDARARAATAGDPDPSPAPAPVQPAPALRATPRSAPEPTNRARPFLRDAALASTTALAVLGGVAFVGFGLQARSADRSLDLCSPNCSRERVATVKREYFWTNASLGTGLAALLGSGLLFLAGQPPANATAGAGARRGAWALRVGPVTTLTAAF